MTEDNFPSICRLSQTAKKLARKDLLVDVYGAIEEIEGFLSLITHEIEQQEAGEDCDLDFDFGALRGFIADLESDIEKLKR